MKQETTFLLSYFKGMGFSKVKIVVKYLGDKTTPDTRYYEAELSDTELESIELKGLMLGTVTKIDFKRKQVTYKVDQAGLARTRKMINSIM